MHEIFILGSIISYQLNDDEWHVVKAWSIYGALYSLCAKFRGFLQDINRKNQDYVYGKGDNMNAWQNKQLFEMWK